MTFTYEENGDVYGLFESVQCLLDEGDLEGHTDTFEDFFSCIDVINAYEEGWNEEKETLKPHYERAYKKIILGEKL